LLQNGGVVQAARLSPDLLGGVQPGWQSANDPSSGRTYWYNTGTQQTQWEFPTGAPPPAAAPSAPAAQNGSYTNSYASSGGGGGGGYGGQSGGGDLPQVDSQGDKTQAGSIPDNDGVQPSGCLPREVTSLHGEGDAPPPAKKPARASASPASCEPPPTKNPAPSPAARRYARLVPERSREWSNDESESDDERPAAKRAVGSRAKKAAAKKTHALRGSPAAARASIEAILAGMGAERSNQSVQLAKFATLRILASSDEDRAMVVGAGGIDGVVAAMGAHTSCGDVQEQGCVVLVNLAASDESRAAIARAGGIEAVVAGMVAHRSSAGVQEQGCWALGVLAAHAANLVNPHTLHPTPYTLHPIPYTLHPTPSILHPTPYTLHPTPYTLHPTP